MADWQCNTCGCRPCVNPTFCKVSREADVKMREAKKAAEAAQRIQRRG